MAAPLEFEMGFSRKGAPRPRDDDPMRILLMGDFSASALRGTAGRPLKVDIDNIEDRLARLSPRIEIPAGADSVTVELRELEDFHPDSLYRRLPVFAGLRELRARLLDPATFAEAADELRAEAAVPPTPTPAPASAPEAPAAAEDDANTFARLLGGEATPAGQRPASATSHIDGLIRGIVAPHIVPEPDPHRDVYVASVDEAIAAQMRAILHDPRFQALEALWRSLHWLVTGLELDEELELHLLDASKEAVAADLLDAGGDTARSALHRTLADQGADTPGGARWAVLAGAYTFGTGDDDVRLLGALGALAGRVGAPFLAQAAPATLGCTDYREAAEPADWPEAPGDDAWTALRRQSVARWIGLALPRVLMRLPYAENADAIDGFDFDELGPERPHEALLWGPAAAACALLLGRAFRSRGWSMEPGDELQIDELPAYTYEEDGETHLLPCAEVLLPERAADAILGRGVMPVMSFRGHNGVRLMRFQSLSLPPAALAGPWS